MGTDMIKDKKNTEARFLAKQSNLKKCVNCEGSEFSSKWCNRQKVPKIAIKCHNNSKKYHVTP